MSRRYYSSTAASTTLSGSIGTGDTTFTVGALTGYPGSFPYTAAIDRGTASEELVTVTGASVSTVTVTRGVDGSTAKSHTVGAAFEHVVSARDFDDAGAHAAATTDVHGITGALLGEDDHVDTDTGTSALHHTLGTGANQAAAGNHTHAAEESWHTVGGGGEPAFAGSWANVGAGFQTLQYKKVGNEVRIRGVVSGSAGTVFTLPAGYRPPLAIDIPATGQFGGDLFAEVLATGAVSVTSLGGYTFIGFATQFWID